MQPEQFEAHARLEDHHWWFTARRTILLGVFGRLTPPGSAVADVGCGTGGNAAAFAKAGYRVLGLDPSQEAIALARRRFSDLSFERTEDPADASEHLSGGGVVVMTDVLEHVADDASLLARAIGAVPAGGHLLLTVPADPTLWSEHDVAFGHHRRYREAEFRALWEDQPVEERLFSHYNSRLRPLIALYRRWSSRRKAERGGDLEVPAGPLNTGFRIAFESEGRALVDSIDSDRTPFSRGVSLMAVLRRL